MARRRDSGDDNDFNIFNSNESIERQTAQWRKASEDVINHTVNYFESRLSRMNANLKKELGDPGKQSGITASLIQKKLKEQQGQSSQGSGSIKDNFINNIINQVGTGSKWDPNKSFMRTAGKELVGLLERSFSIYITKPITSAISDMSSAYESSFSEIAGRMGSDNRKATYNIMKSAVSQLNNSAAKTAVNANKELIPELRNVAARGWKGNEAVSTALTNSIDRKIMPWLDSSTEAWNNLQFNLSDTQMKTLKSQQLILQETQSGNRLLQTGVINSLMTDISPLLSNIDFNTVDVTKSLPEQAQAYMQSLVDKGKYSPQQAYEEVRKILNIYKDPASGFRSGDAYSVLASQAAYQGGDFRDIVESTLPVDQMLANMGLDSSIAAPGLGGSTATGITRPEAFGAREAAILGTDWELTSGASAEAYDNLADNVSQYVTATQAHDNWMQNTTTDLTYGLNNIAHGTDVLPDILSTVQNIASALIMGKIGKYVLGKYAPELLKTTGKTGGLAAGLAKGGSAMAKTAGVELTGGAAKLLGGATVAGGGLLVSKGISTAYDTAKNWDTSSTNDKLAGGFSSLGMIGGGGMAVAAGLGLASGPVGWVGLIIGGLAYAGKKVYDFANKLDENGEKVEKDLGTLSNQYLESNKNIAQSAQDIVEGLSDSNNSLEAENKARKFLVDNGILTEEDANKKHIDELKKLTVAYMNAKAAFKPKELEKSEKATAKLVSDYSKQYGKKQSEALSGALLTQYSTLQQDIMDTKLSEDSPYTYRQLLNDPNYADDPFSVGKLEVDEESGKFKTESANSLIDYIDAAASALTLAGKESDAESLLGQIYSDTSKKILRTDLSPADLYKAATDVTDHYGLSDKSASLAGSAANLDFGDIGMSPEKYGSLATQYTSLLESIYEEMATYNTAEGETKTTEAKKIAKLFKQAHDIELPKDAKATIKNAGVGSLINDLFTEIRDLNLKDLEGIKSFAVGTPYVNEDQLAQIHKGEAIIPAEQNKSRLRSMLGISSSEVSQTKVSSTEIVNAIQSQTSTLKQAIDLIISTIGNLQPAGVSYDTRHVGNDLSRMNSTYGNTRNLS